VLSLHLTEEGVEGITVEQRSVAVSKVKGCFIWEKGMRAGAQVMNVQWPELEMNVQWASL